MYKVVCFKQENMPNVYVVMGKDKYGDWNEIDGRSRYSTKQSAYRRCRSLNAGKK